MATTNKAFRVKSGLIVEGAELKPAAGTTTYPPILLTSGTNLTSATAGAFEYDGTRFYLSPSTTRKAIALTDSTGATLDSTITGSSLTSVGTLTNLTVTNTITGSVSGNAGTVTNGVYTSGSYANPTWITSLAWSKISTTPTTLSGYGITDAASSTHTHGNITNAGAIGSTSGLVAVTTTSGALTVAATPSSTSTQFLRGDLTWVVPTDTYPTTFTYTGGTTAGPTGSLTGSGMSAVSFAAIPAAASGASGIITTGAQTLDGVKTFSSFPEVSGTPSTSNQLVNKIYVDNIASGVNAHDAVIAATTAALTVTYNNNTTGVGATLTNAGTQAALVLDNVSLLSGDRVLVKNQASTLQNGIYTVTTVGTASTNWVLTRASDYDQSIAGEVAAGDTTFVVAPAAQYSTAPTQQNTSWTMNTPGTISIGSSAITFVQSNAATTYTSGTGISISSGAISVDSTVLTTTSTQTGITNKTFTAPVLGAATATTINKVTITAPATGSTLTIAEGKTFTSSNTLTLTGTDGSSLAIGTGGTLGTGAFATIANYVPTSTTVWGQALSGNITGNLTSVGTITGTLGTTLAISVPTASTGNGTGVSLTGGIASASTGSPVGGTVTITGGQQSNATPTGTGGAVNIAAGASGANGQGGSITLDGGAGGANGGGNVTIRGGASGSGNGLINIGTTNTDSIAIGASGKTTTISGTTATTTLTATTVTVNSIANIVTASGSTTGTTALTLSTVYASGTYNGGEFTIKATNSTNIEITKVLVITDGTNVYMTTYGDVYVSTALVTVDFTYTGANVNMVVTPVAGTTGTTSVKVTGTLLAV